MSNECIVYVSIGALPFMLLNLATSVLLRRSQANTRKAMTTATEWRDIARSFENAAKRNGDTCEEAQAMVRELLQERDASHVK